MQFVSSAATVAAVLLVPYALKAAAAVYAEYHAPAQQNIRKPTLPDQLVAIARDAAAAPAAIARQCSVEFKYALYKRTLADFDSRVAMPAPTTGMDFSAEPMPAE